MRLNGVVRRAFHAARGKARALRQRIAWHLVQKPTIAWRSRPISTRFGLDRGMPIDRLYIGRFLESNRASIKGRVLEFGENRYFGALAQPASTLSIFHAVPGNAAATVVGDLGSPAFMEGRDLAFDCILCTQVLQFIFPVSQAVRNLHSMLSPGGVLLATASGISQISRYDMDRWGDYWRFTDASARRMFSEVFGPENVEVVTYGNVLTASAFLYGLAAHEVKRRAFESHDPDYQMVIGVRAVRPRGE